MEERMMDVIVEIYTHMDDSDIRKPRTLVRITLCTIISTGWTLRCTPITKTRIWKQILKKS